MGKEKITSYDKEKEFNDHIKPLMDQIMKQCMLHKIPGVVIFATQNTEEGTKYSSDMWSAVTNDITLQDDKLCKVANVLNGFDVVADHKIMEIDL